MLFFVVVLVPDRCSTGIMDEQTELGVLQRAMEGLQQRLEEAERDKGQASELHSSNTSKVCRCLLVIRFLMSLTTASTLSAPLCHFLTRKRGKVQTTFFSLSRVFVFFVAILVLLPSQS